MLWDHVLVDSRITYDKAAIWPYRRCTGWRAGNDSSSPGYPIFTKAKGAPRKRKTKLNLCRFGPRPHRAETGRGEAAPPGRARASILKGTANGTRIMSKRTLNVVLMSTLGTTLGHFLFEFLVAMVSLANMWPGLPRQILMALPIVVPTGVAVGLLAALFIPGARKRTIGVVAILAGLFSFSGGVGIAVQYASRNVPVQELGGAFSDYTIFVPAPDYYVFLYVGQFITGVLTALLLFLMLRGLHWIAQRR